MHLALQRRVHRDCGGRLKGLLVRWRRRVPLAEDHRRHALRDHADDAAVSREKLRIRLRLNIDDSRRDDEPARVDALLRGRVVQHAGGREPSNMIAADRDVTIEPWITSAVDDLAITDDDVVLLIGALLAGLRFWPYAARGGRGGDENEREDAHRGVTRMKAR